MNGPDLLSILIVSYNCADLLVGCLDSLAANPPSFPFEVVLVDNGSADGTLEMVADRYPQVRLVPNRLNRGFAGGNALAASQAAGDLLLLLNPDTVVLEGAIDALVAALLAEQDRWVAGACLLDRDGSPGTAWGDFPTLGWAIANTAPWNRVGWRPRSRSRMGSTCAGIAEVTSVGWVSGAAFCVRRDAWERLGGLDTAYFMYFEETDFCYRVHEAGGDVVVVPDARIVHLEGGAIGQASTRQRVWFTEGLIRFLSNNNGAIAGLAVRSWVALVNGTLWLASWPAGLVSAHARQERHRYAALVGIAVGRRFAGAPA